jgi:hypothetical protein
MENRVRLLNHQITSTRRGLKNQLKALWWRKVHTLTALLPNIHSPPNRFI